MRLVKLDKPDIGSIYLHHMPAKNETWLEFTKSVEVNQIGLIVCLTPLEEIKTKSPDYAKAIINDQLPCEKYDQAISDFGVPSNLDVFQKSIKYTVTVLNAGNNVLIHCAAGIGRTGLFAICLLHALGIEEEDAKLCVHLAQSTPETTEQEAFVAAFNSPSN